jgi:hypothetical protein
MRAHRARSMRRPFRARVVCPLRLAELGPLKGFGANMLLPAGALQHPTLVMGIHRLSQQMLWRPISADHQSPRRASPSRIFASHPWNSCIRPRVYRPFEFVIPGTTDAAHEMVRHIRHRQPLRQSERQWLDRGDGMACRPSIRPPEVSHPWRDRRELLGDVRAALGAGSWPCCYPAPARRARAA